MTELTIELSADDAARVLEAFNEGKLPSEVTDIRLADDQAEEGGK